MDRNEQELEQNVSKYDLQNSTITLFQFGSK